MTRQTLSWISIPPLEVDIEVDVDAEHAYVDRATLEKMAESIRTSEIADEESDAAYAAEILATKADPDGRYDVGGFDALADQLADIRAEMRQPRTDAGRSLADGEMDGLTEMIVEIEDEASELGDDEWRRPLSADDFAALEKAYEATPPEKRAKTLETLRVYGTTKAVVEWAYEKSERLEREIDEGFAPFVHRF